MPNIGTFDQVPGQRAYEDSIRLSLPDVVSGLREILGVRLVAYIGRVKYTSRVSAWVDGSAIPDAGDQQRLRHAFHAASLLRERYGTTTVQSWFLGMNPALNDQAPAQVLREGDPTQAAKAVIAAAKSFAYIG